MGAVPGDAVDWLEEAMAEDRAEAGVHATPEMKAMEPAHLPHLRHRYGAPDEVSDGVAS